MQHHSVTQSINQSTILDFSLTVTVTWLYDIWAWCFKTLALSLFDTDVIVSANIFWPCDWLMRIIRIFIKGESALAEIPVSNVLSYYNSYSVLKKKHFSNSSIKCTWLTVIICFSSKEWPLHACIPGPYFLCSLKSLINTTNSRS